MNQSIEALKDRLMHFCMILMLIQVVVIPPIGAVVFGIDSFFLDERLLDAFSDYTGANNALGFFRFGLIYFSPVILIWLLASIPSFEKNKEAEPVDADNQITCPENSKNQLDD